MDDEYNKAVELEMQEEATAESDEFQSTISSIKLLPKCKNRLFKRVNKKL